VKEKLIDSLARVLIIGYVFLLSTSLEADNSELTARAEQGEA
jgi:hypothetical protein